jgi:lipid-binding SYLF domain-containing protein
MKTSIVNRLALPTAVAVAVLAADHAWAQTQLDSRLQEAAATLSEFTGDGSLAVETLTNAYGVAIIPNLLRGGFMLGGRRGKGVLVVRMSDGTWSNPAFVTLTGGSVGWQIGVESADVVLVFANQESIRRIQNGKFALGGDASAVAGPVGRRNTAAVTFKSEIYAYVKSRGLFAGASIEGAKLGIDDDANAAFYGSGETRALGMQTASTPANARRLLLGLEPHGTPRQTGSPDSENTPAQTFPLGDPE